MSLMVPVWMPKAQLSFLLCSLIENLWALWQLLHTHRHTHVCTSKHKTKDRKKGRLCSLAALERSKDGDQDSQICCGCPPGAVAQKAISTYSLMGPSFSPQATLKWLRKDTWGGGRSDRYPAGLSDTGVTCPPWKTRRLIGGKPKITWSVSQHLWPCHWHSTRLDWGNVNKYQRRNWDFVDFQLFCSFSVIHFTVWFKLMLFFLVYFWNGSKSAVMYGSVRQKDRSMFACMDWCCVLKGNCCS